MSTRDAQDAAGTDAGTEIWASGAAASPSDVEATKVLADAAVKIARIRWLLAPPILCICAIALMAAAALLHVPIPKP